jgi:hypothetical protein
MTNNCPVCGNDQNVYQIGYDGTWGRFVLCSIHGMQVCKKPPEMQRAYFHAPAGNRFGIALRHLKEQGSGIHRRSE